MENIFHGRPGAKVDVENWAIDLCGFSKVFVQSLKIKMFTSCRLYHVIAKQRNVWVRLVGFPSNATKKMSVTGDFK